MSFSMDCGSDLYGTKHNVTLIFKTRPSVAELAAAAESFFDTKARACRPAGYPDVLFRIETFQVFDDKLMRWVDLYDGAQLQPGQQVWCFQSESIWHSDAQGVIPEAEKGNFTWTTPLGSPRRGRVAADAGVPPTLSEKLRSVFYQVDAGSKGYLVYSDLEQAFRRCDMEFNGANAGDLFQLADSKRANRITYDEWVNFAIRFPNIVDALFFRFRDMPGPGQSDHPAAIAPSPGAAQERQAQLEQYYHDAWQPSARDQQAAEFEGARARVRAQELQQQMQQVNDRQRAAADQAVQAQREQEAAAQEAARLQGELQQAEDAAQRAAEAQRLAQEAAQQQQEAAAAQQRAAQAQAQAQAAAAQAAAAAAAPPPQQYSQPPAYGDRYAPVPSSSPQRDDALMHYEAARRHADAVRLQKEEAEREERNAWDRLYYSPASPHYAPQGGR